MAAFVCANMKRVLLLLLLLVSCVPSPQKVVVNSTVEEKVLEKQLERLTLGESPIEVVFIVPPCANDCHP